MVGRLGSRCTLLAALAVASIAAPTAADAAECRVLEVDLLPTEELQIVIWLEDAAGNYIDTAFITRTTGSYGLGNRPGIMDFKSGPAWPYGRRISTFPVWAHRHGIEWPAVVFQDDAEMNLSHKIDESSRERFYCRPVRPDEALWDAESCASTVYTDKGLLDPERKSKYPPRNDIVFDETRDDESVTMYADLNPFDAVSRATPLGDQPFTSVWSLPRDLPDGDYVVWMEVAREFDQNESYDYPTPDVSFNEYGAPYRGQPSLVYRVDLAVASGESSATTLDYVGYGDPDGADGEIRPPDATISSAPGSGSNRLLVIDEGELSFRVRASVHGQTDDIAPAAAGAPSLTSVSPTSISGSFVAPGDDELDGRVAGFEIRYVAGGEMDEADWQGAAQAPVQIQPGEPGTAHGFTIDGLLPQTRYAIGVRAFDDCYNLGPIALIEATTPRRESGEVDACFIATAAYGTIMASEVAALRGFRDRALRSNLAGELLVEAYYTFGPMAAGLIAPSDTLRRAARGLLAPAVSLARRTVDRLPFLR